METIPLTKKCSKCKHAKDAAEFYSNVSRKDKLANQCKTCMEVLAKAYYTANGDLIRTRARQRKEKAKLTLNFKHRFSRVKQKPSVKEKGWTLTYDDFLVAVQRDCFYCAKPPVFGTDARGLDRLDNNLGYHKANVVACCAECNRIRSNVYTPEETRVMVQALKSYRALAKKI